MMGVAIVSNWPLLSGRLMKAITETNLATALYENKQFDEAIAHYESEAMARAREAGGNQVYLAYV